LQGISLEAKQGDFICISGQPGCGKSTMLRLLAGLESPTSGEILLGDTPVVKAGLNRGVVYQDYSLFPRMTAGENLMAMEKLREVGLDANTG